MLTEKDYCDYDTCVAFRELGYKGISRYFYATKESPLRRYSYDQILTTRIADAVGHTLAIHLYSAQKWLREEKKIEVLALSKGMVGAPYDAQVYTEDYVIQEGIEYNSYEEALLEGIKEAVKILNNK